MSSGDDNTALSPQPVHFNAALVGDIYLSASQLLLNILKYNFVRIASLENVCCKSLICKYFHTQLLYTGCSQYILMAASQ